MSGSLMGLGLLGSFARREKRQCSLATQNCLDSEEGLFCLVGKTNCCLPQRTCRNLFRGLSDWRLALLLCYQKPEITICERAVNLFCRDGTFFLFDEADGWQLEIFFPKVEEGPGICNSLH